MNIIMDEQGRLDPQAMAVEQLSTKPMFTPGTPMDMEQAAAIWLDGFEHARKICLVLESRLEAKGHADPTQGELFSDARR